jgi:hypothetical protein
VARRLIALLTGALACAPTASTVEHSTAPGTASDTLTSLIPAGYGSLRQDDVAIHLDLSALQVRAIPLEESVIRVLSPDSYRALHELVTSQAPRIREAERRNGLVRSTLWYVSFYGLELGETRFSPRELIITNVGRDFRPVEVIGLSAGFGTQRLRQREVQNAVYVFDGQLDVNQPLTASYEAARTSEWSSVLERVERERALVRSRARPPGE